MKPIFTTIDEPRIDGTGDIFEENPTFDEAAAMCHAVTAWNHLTPSEQKKRRIYVAVHLVDVPMDDPRPANEIYDELMLNDSWPRSWNVIPIVQWNTPEEYNAD